MAPGGQQAQRELCPCLIISFLASLGLCCHRFSLTSVSGGYTKFRNYKNGYSEDSLTHPFPFYSFLRYPSRNIL